MELLGCGDRSDGGIHHLISGEAVSTSSSSFTALLELPHSQAVQILHSPLAPPPAAIVFSPDGCLIESAARFSVFSGESPDTTAGPAVKCEPLDSSSPFLSSLSAPLVSDPTVEDNSAPPSLRQAKRKEREKKGNNNNKGSKKKSKSGAGKESSEEAEKLPYVHVRARRGQATDSHSLAERARREKINARMKLLQELVPGCNKISGTAMVLDEIINHVQSLQRQVEFLSMRLAAVNPSIDFNLDSILAVENGSMVDRSFSGMIMPLMWSELQFSGNRQHYQQQWPIDSLNQQVWVREEDSPNFIAPDLSYDSSGNSVSLLSNQVKMKL